MSSIQITKEMYLKSNLRNSFYEFCQGTGISFMNDEVWICFTNYALMKKGENNGYIQVELDDEILCWEQDIICSIDPFQTSLEILGLMFLEG
jgi:hypothetical protein